VKVLSWIKTKRPPEIAIENIFDSGGNSEIKMVIIIFYYGKRRIQTCMPDKLLRKLTKNGNWEFLKEHLRKTMEKADRQINRKPKEV
jgi:hypothetical protein